MAEVTLGTGETLLIDDRDLHFLRTAKSYSRKTMGTPGCYYVQVCTEYYDEGKMRMKYLHRLIMGEPVGCKVDHVNFNGLDNRRKNLRVATNQQNTQHRRKSGRIQSSSPFKGAVFRAKTQNLNKPWRSTIMVAGKQIQLGYFGTAREAAEAYDMAALKHHGEFAHLNFGPGMGLAT